MPEPVKWRVAEVVRVRSETPHVKSFELAVPEFPEFRSGQHVDVRLTAPDGYQAQRSYSIASAPAVPGRGETKTIEITVELIDDGEVSPYFHDVVQEGDTFEVRGPIGGPFTWTASQGGPLLLVGGGSGVVPLMSILRHRVGIVGSRPPTTLLYSSRNFDEVIYRDELERMASDDDVFDLSVTLTRQRPEGWEGQSGRVDAAMLANVIGTLGDPALAYVCGPTGFVESVASMLVDHGLPPETIRTERFGPSGT